MNSLLANVSVKFYGKLEDPEEAINYMRRVSLKEERKRSLIKKINKIQLKNKIQNF